MTVNIIPAVMRCIMWRGREYQLDSDIEVTTYSSPTGPNIIVASAEAHSMLGDAYTVGWYFEGRPFDINEICSVQRL